MGCLYVTRHGQTIWNVENKVCGATDIELTELGHRQAQELGEKIKGIPIDEIIASPLVRARKTAEHIAETAGLSMRTDVRITEQNFGKYEAGARDAEDFLIAKSHFVDNFEGGESMLRVAQRVYNLLDELRAREDKTYLIVAHNGIGRVIHSYFEDMDNEEYAKYSLKNCELKRYEWKKLAD